MQLPQNDPVKDKLLATVQRLLNLVAALVIVILLLPVIILNRNEIASWFSSSGSGKNNNNARQQPQQPAAVYWMPPDTASVADAQLKEAIMYGRELIAHTAKYLGPKGLVMHTTNGLNCQNCHLQAGTAVFGNNYGSVASLYPKFRARSGTVETIAKRVNDCMERSLNGKALDSNGKEMRAIIAYIRFVGSNVPRGIKAEGSGLKDLAWLNRAASTEKGKAVYAAKCQSCHNADGSGQFNTEQNEYIYPALWGPHSYNDGAGLFRLSNFAKYVKYNMPQGVTHENPQLTDEEAWDVAAFINSQPRPHMAVPNDWPDRSKKPVDHPFGPYSDGFSEQQHKYGPFTPILDAQKKNNNPLQQKTK